MSKFTVYIHILTLMNLVIPFGKYKGHSYQNVPDKYKIWLLENCSDLEAKYPDLYFQLRKDKDILDPYRDVMGDVYNW